MVSRGDVNPASLGDVNPASLPFAQAVFQGGPAQLHIDYESEGSDGNFFQDDPFLYARETDVSSGHEFNSMIPDFGTISV